MNSYADTGAFSRRFTASQTLDDADMLQALTTLVAASRAVDSYTRRKFYTETVTRVLNGSGTRALMLPMDVASVSSLKVDTDGDRVYETTLVQNTDYELANEDEDIDDRPPYRVIRLLENSAVDAFPRSIRSVQITAREGYSENRSAVLTSAGAAVTGTLADASDTTLATSAVAFPVIAPGMTLRIESEDIYVLGGATVSPFNVRRGVNGTTAAAHAAAALYSYDYETDVIEAVLIQTGRLWARRASPMLPSLISAPNFGDLQLATGLDPDVQNLLRRVARLGGL